MKKSILTLGFVSAMLFGANAQDAATSSSELKAGNITVELNASSPFSGGGSDPFSLNNNALRFRYFLNENTAFRLGFSIDRAGFTKVYGQKNASTTTAGSTTTEDDKVTLKSNSFTFSIMPGVEKHVMVSDRLSAYYGGYLELTLNSKKASAEVTAGKDAAGKATLDGSYKVEWKGVSVEEPSSAITLAGLQAGTAVTATDAAFTRIGLIGVVGADYYFTKGLYLGVEASWGITGTTFKGSETKTTDNTVSGASSSSTVTDLGKNRAGLIAPAANASFRFGFRF